MTERIPTYGGQAEGAAQLARVFEAAGCRTQLELAAVLEISQPSISDAKRRGAIPSDWLIKLLHLRGINPSWIKDGTGPRFLAPSDDAADAYSPCDCFPPVRTANATIVRRLLRCFPLRELEKELRRRKSAER